MTTPMMPDWSVEQCAGDSTDTTEVRDFYGPSRYPHRNVSLFVSQRTSTRDGLTLHDPAEVTMFAEHQVTRLTSTELRALARDALALADTLDTIDYRPTI
ncbi:hypothetical protein [Rhodococcus sp. PSBB049]|uniref:hypothetical protein n=1 Tax=Rhodococcus sp. PSBB049 TaxID=2812863 RepID=UPI0019820A4F|nr:hypothetical protein [Rhodococcus sp. PSBB049]QSE72202.1 hypothetical protein JYA91_27850 [Rhodococcus sp. PSBB049]